MQSIWGRPFAAGYVDSTKTLFDLGIDTGVLPSEGNAFVLVEVIDFIGGISRASKCAAGYVLWLPEMLNCIADQATHLHWADAIASDDQMVVIHVARTSEMGIGSFCSLGV